MNTVETASAIWPTLPVSRLIAHPGNGLPQADPELTADVAARGVEEPLHVVVTSTGAPQVMDGLRRLAAAQAAGLEEVPVTHRPVIRLAALTPHPDNPRESLDISDAFAATFAAEGCRVPIKCRVLGDGTRQIVDGHRRYYAAQAAGLTHLPYEVDDRDDAGTYVDMVITARHRAGLTDREEAAVLFSAAEAGAGVKRLATAAGSTQKAVKTTLRALKSQAARKAEAAGSIDLATMAALAELEARDQAAAEKVAARLAEDPQADAWWIIRRTNVALDHRAELETHRTELQAQGARLLREEELGPKASTLHDIIGDTSTHGTDCQGAVWVLKEGATRYAEYCSNTELFGHQVRATDGQAAQAKPNATERRRVIAGNLDWTTAEQRRREWLAALLTRRSLTRTTADQMTQVAASALLTADPNLASRIHSSKATARLSALLAMPEGATWADVAKRWTQPKDAPRLVFAAVAAAYEGYADRTAWRESTSYVNANRAAAAQWLAWLCELGYEPSPIEQAVRDGQEYQPAAEATGDTLS